jgi:hypothetical protein
MRRKKSTAPSSAIKRRLYSSWSVASVSPPKKCIFRSPLGDTEMALSNLQPSALLDALNQNYLHIHFAKEDAFWKDKMGLASKVPGEFEQKEILLQAFQSNPEHLPA